MEPTIVLYDLEVSREVVEGYRQKFDFKVVKTLRYQELMCFAYKKLGERRTHYVSRNHFKQYKDFVQNLADVLSSADITVAHNGRQFDDKMANTFFIKEGISVPKPRLSIDTCQQARSIFRFPGNSLNQLAEFLGLGSKAKITYADIETEFMTHPTRKIEKLMEKYNKTDVELLEKVYLKLRPFMKTHPNLTVYNGAQRACPICKSSRVQKRGIKPKGQAFYQWYWCKDCTAWSRQRVKDKTYKLPEIVTP